MSQIHDMPWARAGAPQQVRYLLTKLRHGSEQGSRIEVSLNRRPIADVHPGLVDVGSPINPDDIAARGVQLFQKAADSGAKVNHGSGAGPDALNQRSRIRLDVADVVFGTQRAHPAIEYLNGAGAG